MFLSFIHKNGVSVSIEGDVGIRAIMYAQWSDMPCIRREYAHIFDRKSVPRAMACKQPLPCVIEERVKVRAFRNVGVVEHYVNRHSFCDLVIKGLLARCVDAVAAKLVEVVQIFQVVFTFVFRAVTWEVGSPVYEVSVELFVSAVHKAMG